MRLRYPIAFLFAVSLAAQNRPMIPDHYYRTFSHTNPVFQKIQPGEVVVTKTLDSGGQNERDEQVSPGSNPLTGPFFIEGAAAGDALVVKLRKVRLNRNWGYSAYRLGLFSLTPDYVETIYPNHYRPDVVRKGRDNVVPWDIDAARGTVRLREPASGKLKLEFPVRPIDIIDIVSR
jgi:acetamidase/formamidase